MRRIAACAAAFLLAAGALVTTGGGRARAQEIRPQLVIQDACKVATASVTKSWNPTSPVVRADGTPPYGSDGCTKYVADFDVPTLTPLGGHTTDFSFIAGLHWTNELLHLDAAACQTLVVDAIIYRRAVRSTELVRIGGGRKRGQIQNSTCTLVNDASWVEPPPQTPPGQGTNRYRVAQSAKLGQNWLPVSITLRRPY